MAEHGGSVQVCRARVARLDTNGVPLPGAGNLFVSDFLMTVSSEPEVTEGEDIELQNGCGDNDVVYKDEDRIKRFNIEVSWTKPDPVLHALLTGGDVLSDAGEALGFAAPELGRGVGRRVSFEAWSKHILDGEQHPEFPWIRWVWPRTYFTLGTRELANAALENPLTGYGVQNPNFYDGPANDIPADYLSMSHRAFYWFYDEVIPEATGTVALAAS
jgi:hypothetical protein